LVDLENESGQTDDTGQTSAREGGGLASTGSRHRVASRSDTASGSGNGGVGVDATGVADNHRSGGDGPGDSARAVSDGQGGGSCDSVGLGAVGDFSRPRAVGGVHVDDLGGDGDIATIDVGVDANGSSDKSNSVLHFVG